MFIGDQNGAIVIIQRIFANDLIPNIFKTYYMFSIRKTAIETPVLTQSTVIPDPGIKRAMPGHAVSNKTLFPGDAVDRITRML